MEREMEAIFRQRAAALALGDSALASHSRRIPLAIFRLGAERFGINLAHLSEVAVFRGCTPLPGQPGYFLGIMNCGGSILQVSDLAVLFGLPAQADAASTGYVMVLRQSGFPSGFRVDEIEGVGYTAVSEMDSRAGDGAAAWSKYLWGCSEDGLPLLDAQAVLVRICLSEAALA
jgi:chemotaxis signal transduction protein